MNTNDSKAVIKAINESMAILKKVDKKKTKY